MKILHVVPSMSINNGGPPRAIASLSAMINSLGHESRILTTDLNSAPQAKMITRGLQISDIPEEARTIPTTVAPLSHPYRWCFSGRLPELARPLIASSDIVHIHTLYLYPQLVAFRLSRSSKVPFVVSPHGAFDPSIRNRGRLRKQAAAVFWQNEMFRTAGAIHSTGITEKQWIEEYGYTSQTLPIPLPSEFDVATDECFRSRDSNTDTITIANHGRLAPKKQLHILVRAGAILRNRNYRVKLFIVGPDEEGVGDELRQLAVALGVEDLIDISPTLTGASLVTRLMATDIWALPSSGENYGVAVLEAMALGLPVIATPEVAAAKDAADLGAAILTEPDPPALAAALERLILVPSERYRIATLGRQYSRQFTREHLAPQYEAFYRQSIVAVERK